MVDIQFQITHIRICLYLEVQQNHYVQSKDMPHNTRRLFNIVRRMKLSFHHSNKMYKLDLTCFPKVFHFLRICLGNSKIFLETLSIPFKACSRCHHTSLSLQNQCSLSCSFSHFYDCPNIQCLIVYPNGCLNEVLHSKLQD